MTNADQNRFECPIRSIFFEFYNRQMMPVVVIVWVQAIVYIAIAVYSAVRFFDTEQTKDMIMYATIFLTMMVLLCLIKVLAFQFIQRHTFLRRIDALEKKLNAGA